jgi:hypothetical protein
MAEERGDCNREIAGYFSLCKPGKHALGWSRLGGIAAPLANGLVSAASLAVNGGSAKRRADHAAPQIKP